MLSNIKAILYKTIVIIMVYWLLSTGNIYRKHNILVSLLFCPTRIWVYGNIYYHSILFIKHFGYYGIRVDIEKDWQLKLCIKSMFLDDNWWDWIVNDIRHLTKATQGQCRTVRNDGDNDGLLQRRRDKQNGNSGLFITSKIKQATKILRHLFIPLDPRDNSHRILNNDWSLYADTYFIFIYQ